ncbi:hypothetical protein PG279_01380 [Riemerella anatipestifer]|nr:hypothetical protein [Riemerella anatipestifer]
MKQYQDVKLSGKYTDLSFWAGLIFMPPIFALFFYILMGGEHGTLKTIIFGLIFGAIAILFLWIWAIMCKATIKNNQLHLKKYFRPTKVYELSEIIDVKTMNFTNAKHIQVSGEGVKLRKDTYNLVTMEKNGIKEKFMIVGYNFFLGSEPVDSEQILKEILTENKKTKGQI